MQIGRFSLKSPINERVLEYYEKILLQIIDFSVFAAKFYHHSLIFFIEKNSMLSKHGEYWGNMGSVN
jgi:hypothetical protein